MGNRLFYCYALLIEQDSAQKTCIGLWKPFLCAEPPLSVNYIKIQKNWARWHHSIRTGTDDVTCPQFLHLSIRFTANRSLGQQNGIDNPILVHTSGEFHWGPIQKNAFKFPFLVFLLFNNFTTLLKPVERNSIAVFALTCKFMIRLFLSMNVSCIINFSTDVVKNLFIC